MKSFTSLLAYGCFTDFQNVKGYVFLHFVQNTNDISMSKAIFIVQRRALTCKSPGGLSAILELYRTLFLSKNELLRHHALKYTANLLLNPIEKVRYQAADTLLYAKSIGLLTFLPNELNQKLLTLDWFVPVSQNATFVKQLRNIIQKQIDKLIADR